MPVKVRDAPERFSKRVQLRELSTKAIRAGGVTTVAGTGSYLAILATTSAYASTSIDAAEIRSVLLPCTLLCAGLSMMFSVPAQIGGARRNPYPGGVNVRKWMVSAGLIITAFLVLFATVRLALLPLEKVLFSQLDNPRSASAFLSTMVLGYLFVALSDFAEGHLRGRGKFITASVLVLARAAAISVGYIFALTFASFDPNLLPYFYLSGGIVSSLLAVAFVMKDVRSASVFEMRTPSPSNNLFFKVGLPVFASYLLLSAVVSAQLLVVQAGLGRSGQIAFSGLLFVQTLCVVAATGVAAGASSVVVADALSLKLTRAQVGSVVTRIGNYVGVLEFFPFVIALIFGNWIIPLILVGIDDYKPFIMGSYLMVISALLTANNVMMVTILEELGFAGYGFVLNLIYLILLIIITFVTSVGFGSFNAVGAGLAVLSFAAFCALRLILRRLPKGSVF